MGMSPWHTDIGLWDGLIIKGKVGRVDALANVNYKENLKNQ